MIEPDNAEVNRRCPTDEGEWPWGCHTEVADGLAAIADTWIEMYDVLRPLFTQWDTHMTQFAMSRPSCDAETIRAEGLRWLLKHGVPAFELVTRCAGTADLEVTPTPDETRDWFCWLYRQFKSWKIDQ